MNYNYLNIIGLMTGTSVDGIDISLVKTNGIDLNRLNKNYYYEYDDNTKDLLLSIINEDLNLDSCKKKYLDEIVTDEHFKALKSLEIIKTCDLIGFHGQTIYHNPKKNISIQLGDPYKLAKKLKIDVIFDFRINDIKNGGQGAPLAPIYHKYILDKLNLELPSVILNVGGITNLTYWDGNTLIGFDTGPGNALMDNFIRQTSNKYFDKDGLLASQGISNKKVIKKFLTDVFFQKPPPKSLDRNSFKNFYDEVLNLNISSIDVMATLTEFTAETIKTSLHFLPKKIKNILITGGGCRNKHLMTLLKERIDVNFINESDINFNFDYVEAELIAYLSARSIYKLPFTFPSTTGVSRPSSGGELYKSS